MFPAAIVPKILNNLLFFLLKFFVSLEFIAKPSNDEIIVASADYGIKVPAVVEDKIFFGGIETKKYTEMSLVKVLFVHESVYRKFLKHFSEYINFEVVEIKKLSGGDISDKLFHDFDKFIGELYY